MNNNEEIQDSLSMLALICTTLSKNVNEHNMPKLYRLLCNFNMKST